MSTSFQEVQGESALGASLRILPALVMAVLTNISTGYFINRTPVIWAVLISSALTAVSPLLMAIVDPKLPYWDMAFVAQVNSSSDLYSHSAASLIRNFIQVLSPLSPDVLFTVGLLVISAVFPSHTQARGGAVFNTCAQLGASIGFTITSVIANSRTAASSDPDKMSPGALLLGYRAVFWAMFAWMIFVCFVGMLGLRRAGKIGTKQD